MTAPWTLGERLEELAAWLEKLACDCERIGQRLEYGSSQRIESMAQAKAHRADAEEVRALAAEVGSESSAPPPPSVETTTGLRHRLTVLAALEWLTKPEMAQAVDDLRSVLGEGRAWPEYASPAPAPAETTGLREAAWEALLRLEAMLPLWLADAAAPGALLLRADVAALRSALSAPPREDRASWWRYDAAATLVDRLRELARHLREKAESDDGDAFEAFADAAEIALATAHEADLPGPKPSASAPPPDSGRALRWHYPEAERPRDPLCCYDCLRPYRELEDTIVSDDVWVLISPTGNGGGILCAPCMAQRLKALGLWRVPAIIGNGGHGALICGEGVSTDPVRVQSHGMLMVSMPPDEGIRPQPPDDIIEARKSLGQYGGIAPASERTPPPAPAPPPPTAEERRQACDLCHCCGERRHDGDDPCVSCDATREDALRESASDRAAALRELAATLEKRAVEARAQSVAANERRDYRDEQYRLGVSHASRDAADSLGFIIGEFPAPAPPEEGRGRRDSEMTDEMMRLARAARLPGTEAAT